MVEHGYSHFGGWGQEKGTLNGTEVRYH